MTDGDIGTINEPYLHYAFSKGVSDWLAKHNRYSTEEANQAIQAGTKVSLGDLLSRDRIRRRRALKRLSFRLPMRDKLRLIQLLILQGGILEGRAGLMFARLIAIYERMINIKYQLLCRNSSFEADVVPPKNQSE